VPIRRLFVQQGNNPDTRPGPLAEFLTGHDDRGLEAYLFVHAMAARFPWDCKLPSEAWVGALGLAENAALDSAKAAVSKIMRRLEQRKLITRTRSKRLSDITLCKEDGSGDEYVHPIEFGEPYLQLPHSYWLEGHHTSLHLPAKIMLLIALSLQAGFNLPYNRARDWYGVGEDSAKEGLHDCASEGCLPSSRHGSQHRAHQRAGQSGWSTRCRALSPEPSEGKWSSLRLASHPRCRRNDPPRMGRHLCRTR
jgi:hypothetical protein